MKKKVLSVSLFLAVLLILAGVALSFFGGNSEKSDMKNIQITVVANENSQLYDIETDCKYLGDALLNEGIIKGEEGQYGLFITEVAGIKADSDNEEWWCITKGGESIQLGISSIEISDGEKYELTLMVGYGE